jgi:hypothetical protein
MIKRRGNFCPWFRICPFEESVLHDRRKGGEGGWGGRRRRFKSTACAFPTDGVQMASSHSLESERFMRKRRRRVANGHGCGRRRMRKTRGRA